MKQEGTWRRMNHRHSHLGKQFIVLCLLCCLLVAGAFPAAGAEKKGPPAMVAAVKYDFDFLVRLHPEAFSGNIRRQIDGYADLLTALRFEGSLTLAKKSDNFDLQLSVIPVSRPEGAIDLHVYGCEDTMVFRSNLLGEKFVWLSNYSMLNFCSKMSEHLGIPLQYLGLLYPYSWKFGLKQPLEDWIYMAELVDENGIIPESAVQDLWLYWSYRLDYNDPLNILIDALCKDTEVEDAFRAMVSAIPDSFIHDFLQDREIRVRQEEGNTTWENFEGKAFYTEHTSGSFLSRRVDLPRMKTGYQPLFFEEQVEENDALSDRLEIQLLGGEKQQDLLDLKLSLVSFPRTWPADCYSLLSLSQTGELLPKVGFSCYLSGEENGHCRLEIRKPTVEMEPGSLLLTVEGQALPSESEVADFDTEREWDAANVLDILVANDATINAYLPQVMEPALKGLSRFLIGIPTSACQAILDDLTEMGVFTVLLGE